jgi:hypothetical protein
MLAKGKWQSGMISARPKLIKTIVWNVEFNLYWTNEGNLNVDFKNYTNATNSKSYEISQSISWQTNDH